MGNWHFYIQNPRPLLTHCHSPCRLQFCLATQTLYERRWMDDVWFSGTPKVSSRAPDFPQNCSFSSFLDFEMFYIPSYSRTYSPVNISLDIWLHSVGYNISLVLCLVFIPLEGSSLYHLPRWSIREFFSLLMLDCSYLTVVASKSYIIWSNCWIC